MHANNSLHLSNLKFATPFFLRFFFSGCGARSLGSRKLGRWTMSSHAPEVEAVLTKLYVPTGLDPARPARREPWTSLPITHACGHLRLRAL